MGLATASLILLLALPIVALVLKAAEGSVLARLTQPAILAALRLSLLTSTAATALAVLLGTPVAYLLATRRFRGDRLLQVLVDLPMVLPPTVAGLALLLAFGRFGLAGRALQAFGIALPFTTLGVVVAQAFMATPFFVNAARAGFAAVDQRYLEAARTLRASEPYAFFRVRLPLSLPALVGGAVMCWARALGEFGATITFAGNMRGVTQTMPLAVYVELQRDLDAAIAVSVLLLLLAGVFLLGIRLAPMHWTIATPNAPAPGR